MTEVVDGTTGEVVDKSWDQFMDEQVDALGGEDDSQVLEGLEAPEEETAGQGGDSGGEGTDVVLERLARTDPPAAKVLRAMQRRMSQNNNEFSVLKGEILDIRERLLEREEAQDSREQEGSEGRALPEGVTEENVALFKQVADHLGYIPREELDSRERDRSTESYVADSLQEGVELFGEDFGEVGDDGQVSIAPELKARLDRRLKSLQDPRRGITPLDLFILEQGRDILSRARGGERGSEKPAQQGPTREARPVRRANVARRTSGGQARVQIYDPKRGDSGEDVFDRAWALAKRDLSGR